MRFKDCSIIKDEDLDPNLHCRWTLIVEQLFRVIIDLKDPEDGDAEVAGKEMSYKNGVEQSDDIINVVGLNTAHSI